MPSIFLKGHQAMAGKESGQAALLAVILLPVLLLAALFVFNTGQLTATKLRTQNAADGAAYSAMQLQARQLNFIAYTNRAMVANQVAMGQMVSLVSWSRYAKTLGENIDHLGTLASWIPGVGQIIKSITQTIQQISSALETGVSAMSRVAIPILDQADSIYSSAQDGFNVSFYTALPIWMNRVVAFNDPKAEIDNMLVGIGTVQYKLDRNAWLTQWGGTGSKGKPLAQARMATLINASRDGFTAERNALPTPLQPVGDKNLYAVKWRFDRRGGSQIAQDPNSGEYLWSGIDTLSFRLWNWRCDWRGCRWRGGGEMSLGYGAAHTTNLSQYDYGMRHYTETYADPNNPGKGDQHRNIPTYQGSWGANPRASSVAAYQNPDRSGSFTPSPLDSRREDDGGISRYWDLVGRTADNTDNAPSLMVMVRHSRNAVRDSVTALGITRHNDHINLELPQKAAGNEIRAVAKAQVYFRRPTSLWVRPDRLDERGNLFSPFWEARLVDLTETERAAIAVAR